MLRRRAFCLFLSLWRNETILFQQHDDSFVDFIACHVIASYALIIQEQMFTICIVEKEQTGR